MKMKTIENQAYGYCMLVFNRPNLQQERTFFDSKYLKSKKYALIFKNVYKDSSELITHIKYSNDLSNLIEIMKGFCSWYDQITGLKKDIQGNISEY